MVYSYGQLSVPMVLNEIYFVHIPSQVPYVFYLLGVEYFNLTENCPLSDPHFVVKTADIPCQQVTLICEGGMTESAVYQFTLAAQVVYEDNEPNLIYSDVSYYSDVIMSAVTSQFTGVLIVCSTVFFRCRSKKTSKLRVAGLCEGN